MNEEVNTYRQKTLEDQPTSERDATELLGGWHCRRKGWQDRGIALVRCFSINGIFGRGNEARFRGTLSLFLSLSLSLSLPH